MTEKHDKSPKDQSRPPRAFKLDKATETAPKKPAAKPSQATKKNAQKPRKPQKLAMDEGLEILPDAAAEYRQSDPILLEIENLTPPVAGPKKSKFSLSKLFFAALGALISLSIGLYVDGMVRMLFQHHTWLGWLGLFLTALLVIAALGITLREIFAILQLRSFEKMRQTFDVAIKSTSKNDANDAVKGLLELYQNRPDLARGIMEINALQNEIVDASDYLQIAEKQLLSPLDIRARKLILDSAKRVSIVTAVSPRALIDIAYVLMENFKLIKNLSQLYGGKPGILGFWKLTYNILAHLALTGTLALSDGLLQQAIGHGLASRLSARFGEGVLNGLLTARIGISAMDICRPAPFMHKNRPSASDFLSDLLKLSSNKP